MRSGATTYSTNDGSCTVKRVRPTRKTSSRVPVHFSQDPVLPKPKRWKRLAPPGSFEPGGEEGVPRHLFPRLGVGCPGRLEPAPVGNWRKGFRLVSPAERTRARE